MPSGHPIPTPLAIAPPGLGDRFATKRGSKIIYGRLQVNIGNGWGRVSLEGKKGVFVLRVEKLWKVAEAVKHAN